MIVNLGNWKKNPEIASICEQLGSIEQFSKKSTPQNCLFKVKSKTVVAIGLDDGVMTVEFALSEDNYALVHGNDFVVAHPLPQMAREGWLQARPTGAEQIATVVSWIKESIS
jgi:hypothetical protein